MLLHDFEKKVVNGSYSLNERLWTQDVKDHVSTWHDAFRERVLSYDQRGLLFNYYDGAYYAETSSVFEVVPEYLGARLISLNGKSIDDMVFDVYERYVPRYDSENDKFFRTSLIFNESAGEKYTAELEMPDGKIVTVDIFDNPGFDLAVVDRKQIYPEDLTAGTEDTADKNESAAGTENKPVSYFIAEDAGRKLVYIRYNSCYLPEAERLADDIRTSLNNVGAEYIILDIRGNRGGDSTAVTKYLCL